MTDEDMRVWALRVAMDAARTLADNKLLPAGPFDIAGAVVGAAAVFYKFLKGDGV